MRILVVDDNPGIRDMLSSCRSYQGRCDLAENGLIAVEMFHQASSERDPYTLIASSIALKTDQIVRQVSLNNVW